jgi:hypothetical protein
MEYYVGLDVSLKQTSICVVNQAGSVVREGIVDRGLSKHRRMAEPDPQQTFDICPIFLDRPGLHGEASRLAV